jgi:4-hydroxybenzoate polyprenyltransferase
MTTPAGNRPRSWGERFNETTFATSVLPQIAATLGDYGRLMRVDRPIGTFLLLWPALWALWIASDGRPDPHVFIVFTLGVFLMRSAGCVINDFADRKIDPHVRRTRERPMAQGRVEPKEALILFVALSLIALGLVMTLDRFTQQLALVGAVLTVTYPFFKRFFPIPQMYLGIAFSWSVPIAYAAEAGTVSRIGWLLFMASLLWTTAYDTMYAMVDREDDLRIGVRSSAILFGDADRAIIGIMQLMTLLALWLAGRETGLGAWYQGGLAAAACFSLYEQWLIRDRSPEKCFRAFLNNNYFGMVVFIGIALEYLFRH